MHVHMLSKDKIKKGIKENPAFSASGNKTDQTKTGTDVFLLRQTLFRIIFLFTCVCVHTIQMPPVSASAGHKRRKKKTMCDGPQGVQRQIKYVKGNVFQLP